MVVLDLDQQLAELIARLEALEEMFETRSESPLQLSPLLGWFQGYFIPGSQLRETIDIYAGILKDARRALGVRSELTGLDIMVAANEERLGELPRRARSAFWHELRRHVLILRRALIGYRTGKIPSLAETLKSQRELSKLRERERTQILGIALIILGFGAIILSGFFTQPGTVSTVELLGAKVSTSSIGLIVLVLGVVLLLALLLRK